MQRCTLKYIPAEGTAGAEVLRWEPFSSGLAEAEGQRKERLQSDHTGSWKSLLQSGHNQKLVETFDRVGGWGGDMMGFPFSETTLAAERRTEHTHPCGARMGSSCRSARLMGWVRSSQMEDAF